MSEYKTTLREAAWPSAYRASDLKSVGRGFKSRSDH